MPKEKDLLRLMRDATAFCDDYRGREIDPAYRRADNMYHMIHENQAEYDRRRRSSLYIPKVRNHVRKWVSSIVSAFMSSDDPVSISYPIDPNKERFTNEVFNRRLENDARFLMFLADAAHVHVKYGNCVGKVGWEYGEETVDSKTYPHPDTGEVVTEDVVAPTVDRPFLEVVPFENIHIDYRCIGTDPTQESSFLRHWIPMYVTDVERKFSSGEWKRPKGIDWKSIKVPDSTFLVRSSRHGQQADPSRDTVASDPGDTPRSYDQVWVVENYFRILGTDWTFLSIGDEGVLTVPQRTVDKFPHGKRPFALSKFDPESFRVYSDGLPEIEKNLQYENNAIRNQRRDNVALALNAGYIIRKGAGIQKEALVNSTPGRVVVGEMISPNDIRREEVADITASAYREEDMVNRDLEETSSRSLNMMGVTSSRTTATEAAISASATGEMEGYIIKTFVEMLIKPLLEMFADNLYQYENDQQTLIRAAITTGLPHDPELICRGEVIINAGMGSTNKELRSARLQAMIDRGIQMAAVDPSFLTMVKELFRDWLPLSGFKNIDRYFPASAQQSPPEGSMPDESAVEEAVGGAPGNQGSPVAQIPHGNSVDPQLSALVSSVPGIGGFARGMLQ